MAVPSFLKDARVVFTVAAVFRAILLVYGRHQDQVSSLKYTDIDYFVFTDAARNVYWGRSPYARDTYRYTPLLAWLLVPTAWGGWWFDFGKALFALCDILAGWLIMIILRDTYQMSNTKSLAYSCLWSLNPMVANISTRGSSEGVLAVLVIALLWATLQRQTTLAGFLLGLAVHLKIYPFLYALAIFWWLEPVLNTAGAKSSSKKSNELMGFVQSFFSPERLTVVATSAITFCVLNSLMWALYGSEFFEHTFLYHFVRTDHRHNFALHNMLLYLNSSPSGTSSIPFERLAFLPQLVLSAVWIPLSLAKQDLATCMLAQTLAFVTFNKVCTSQRPKVGVTALILWILGQALWLQQGFMLEFLGRSSFLPGLWIASLLFFGINIWILGIVIDDVRHAGSHLPAEHAKTQ